MGYTNETITDTLKKHIEVLRQLGNAVAVMKPQLEAVRNDAASLRQAHSIRLTALEAQVDVLTRQMDELSGLTLKLADQVNQNISLMVAKFKKMEEGK